MELLDFDLPYECTEEYWRNWNRAAEMERLESEDAEIEYRSRVRLDREYEFNLNSHVHSSDKN